MTTFECPSGRRRLAVRCLKVRVRAFTLIELLLVITIIAILASLLMPAVGTMQQKADSIKCSSNLRAIGAAVQCYLQDNSFNYPCIEPLPKESTPVYPTGFQPTPYSSMVAAFGQYGVTMQTTQCPSDMKSPAASCSFLLYGSSYDWRPTLDDESANDPLVYTRRFFSAGTSGSSAAIIAKLSKVRQSYDDNTGIHFGHVNALYADGHVVMYTGPTTSGASH